MRGVGNDRICKALVVDIATLIHRPSGYQQHPNQKHLLSLHEMQVSVCTVLLNSGLLVATLCRLYEIYRIEHESISFVGNHTHSCMVEIKLHLRATHLQLALPPLLYSYCTSSPLLTAMVERELSSRFDFNTVGLHETARSLPHLHLYFGATKHQSNSTRLIRALHYWTLIRPLHLMVWRNVGIELQHVVGPKPAGVYFDVNPSMTSAGARMRSARWF